MAAKTSPPTHPARWRSRDSRGRRSSAETGPGAVARGGRRPRRGPHPEPRRPRPARAGSRAAPARPRPRGPHGPSGPGGGSWPRSPPLPTPIPRRCPRPGTRPGCGSWRRTPPGRRRSPGRDRPKAPRTRARTPPAAPGRRFRSRPPSLPPAPAWARGMLQPPPAGCTPHPLRTRAGLISSVPRGEEAHSSTSPRTQVTVPPPTQIWPSRSAEMWIRPERPSAVPWLAT